MLQRRYAPVLRRTETAKDSFASVNDKVLNACTAIHLSPQPVEDHMSNGRGLPLIEGRGRHAATVQKRRDCCNETQAPILAKRKRLGARKFGSVRYSGYGRHAAVDSLQRNEITAATTGRETFARSTACGPQCPPARTVIHHRP